MTTFHTPTRIRATLLAGAAALLLAGCGNPSYTISDAARASAISENPAAPAPRDFPDPARAKWSQGTFPSVEALRRMGPGMGKDQVRELLSHPHFSEGLGGVREWNYIFHFRTGKANEIMTCQYMVRFNKDALTNGMYWKDPACAALLVPPPVAVVAPAPAPAPVAAAPRKVSLAADGLFRFDGGSAAALQPQGRRRIEALAQEIRRDFGATASIRVVGHTDRLGSAAYNERLSQQRADTVRDLLVAQGIERARIRSHGQGERQPVTTDCTGERATPALIACLQPNRRVDVEVTGER